MFDENVLLNVVVQHTLENPQAVAKVIQAATTGVQAFASKQSDRASKLAFMVTDLIEANPHLQYGVFSKKDVFELIQPWLEGTPWWTSNAPSSMLNQPERTEPVT